MPATVCLPFGARVKSRNNGKLREKRDGNKAVKSKAAKIRATKKRRDFPAARLLPQAVYAAEEGRVMNSENIPSSARISIVPPYFSAICFMLRTPKP